MSTSWLRELETEFGESEIISPEHELAAELEFELEQFDPRPPPPGATLLTRFGFASAVLTAAHKATLRQFASTLVGRMPLPLPSPEHCPVIVIEGHEDELGDPQNYGIKGLERARAVRRELIKNLTNEIRKLPAARGQAVLRQLDPRLIITISAGPTKPIRSNVTKDGQALNRRAEIRVGFIKCRTIV